MRKNVHGLFLLSFALIACVKAEPELSEALPMTASIPEGNGSETQGPEAQGLEAQVGVTKKIGGPLKLCAKAPADLVAAGFQDQSTLDKFLRASGVKSVNAIDPDNVVQFAFELAKMPESIRRFVKKNGGGIRILNGRGVADNTTWPPGVKDSGDGRSYGEIPGAGGPTARIVANRLYEGHGSNNLVLHELAHTADYYADFSTDRSWQAVQTEPDFVALMDKYCGSYCSKSSIEGFAEAVAMYYGCSASRLELASSHAAMRYFKSFSAP